MRRPVLWAIILISVLAAVGLAWWLVPRGTATTGPPPTPSNLDRIDPFVADLVRETLGEIGSNPGDPAARSNLAMVYHANGLDDLATETYRQVLDLDARRADAWYQLARLAADRGDMTSAYAALDRLVSIEPEYVPAYWRRGFWLLEDGRADEAEASFREAVELAPSDLAPRVGLARCFIQRQRYQQATEVLEPIVGQHPDLAYTQHLLAIAYRALGRHEEAARAAVRGAGVAPGWADAWRDEVSRRKTGYPALMKRSDAQLDAGDANGAVATLKTLQARFPDDAVVLAKLGEIHKAARQWSEARRYLTTAIQKKPDYHPAHLHLAEVMMNVGEIEPAQRHVDRAIELYPTMGYAYLLRADILMRRKPPDYTRAVVAMQSAIRYGKNDPATRVNLAKVQLMARQWTEARDGFQSMTSTLENRADVWAGLAWANAELGDIDGALRALARAQTLSRTDATVQQAARRIQELR